MKNRMLSIYSQNMLYKDFMLCRLTKLAAEANGRARDADSAFLQELVQAGRGGLHAALSRFDFAPNQLLKKLTDTYLTDYVSSGIENFDFYIGGLKKSALSLVENGTSKPMSVLFVLRTVYHIGVEKQIPTAYFSLDQDKQQLQNCFLKNILCRDDAFEVQNGWVFPDE